VNRKKEVELKNSKGKIEDRVGRRDDREKSER